MQVTRREMIGKKRQFFSENGYPKVLVACPIYEQKFYCINDYFANLRELSYPNKDFLFVDNSPDQSAIDVVREFNPDMRIEQIPFAETTRASQSNAYNYIRDEFLKGDYQYLVIIESDVFPHETIIEDMMVNDKDICGALYIIKGMECSDEQKMPCVTTGIYKAVAGGIREAFMNYREIDGELKQIKGGCGLGCIIIKRKVIEDVPFRWFGMAHADTYFHRDAHRKGYETWIDTRFMCAHYPSPYPCYY